MWQRNDSPARHGGSADAVSEHVGHRRSEHPEVGLGEELEDEIDAVLTMIRRFPEAAPQGKHRRDRRVAVLRRFPFTLPHQIGGDEIAPPAEAPTVEVLIEALDPEVRAAIGDVDRTLIALSLQQSPWSRLRSATRMAQTLGRLRRALASQGG
jgi:hypothetical protein